MDPDKFEETFVKNIYSNIAEHFDKTRYHTWPKIKDFINSLNTNSKIYDIGCGNGRNMNLRDDCDFIGCDNNQELLSQAKNKKLECFYGDNLDLPFEDECADAVISIAVIHHFSTKERRIKALSEIFRILKKGGYILIYVWAYEQDKFKNYEKNAMVEWNNQKNNETLKRYYYLFSRYELDDLVKSNFDNIEIQESGEQCFNYYLICKKF
tara:strand:- start:10833 stop:11462 length:630 start_codon:yes stop_codon:yes gene_type:complete